MPRGVRLTVPIVGLGLAGTKAANALRQEAGKLVILDTDPGIDDAMALLYLRAVPGIRLHSLTTVFGNADIETTSRNAAFLAARFGLDLPIHVGAAGPLEGERHVPSLKVHGADGLGGTGVASGTPVPRSTVPAWQHIADTISANPGRVSLLAIGPLTNLALALRHRPEIAAQVHEVVVMGGAFGTRGRHGNIRPHAEANFFYDPRAADEVLAASWPVTAVGLDVSADCILSSAQAASMARCFGESGELLWAISRDYADIYRKFDGIDGFCIHDVAAAARLASPELFSVQQAAIGVKTSGNHTGNAYRSADAMRPVQSFCDGVDSDRLISGFIDIVAAFVARDAASERIETT
ncbi:MAG: nucleoside hydrolase [Alphaproteobacteria bacterium HGW-Alphaproteobacteria-13]|nr:MAG: nucleoside hydrolase [Alphaproteobacteria bacterium HGW-Alphaproteobacteria-13]